MYGSISGLEMGPYPPRVALATNSRLGFPHRAGGIDPGD